MKLLLDTNVLIPGEPISPEGLVGNSPAVIELVRWAAEGGHQLLLHPDVRFDVARDADDTRRAALQLLMGKYIQLMDPPQVPPDWTGHLGSPPKGSNDWVDHQLLAALSRNAVNALVTEDRGIHRKAKRVGVDSRVLTIADAVAMLRSLAGVATEPPPAVKATLSHAFDVKDRFFDSLRQDYGGPAFDAWLVKCQVEHRECWLIEGPKGSPAAICIYKDEAGAFEFGGKLLKLCTFKVDDAQRGRRLGELLLKAAFAHCAANRHEAVYVTVLPKHGRLVDLFTDFGFEQRATQANGELVLFKYLRADPTQTESALAFHVRHGPPAFETDAVASHFVPIEPRYHRLLFPDAEAQKELMPGTHPFGNGIRKAYLCRASKRTLDEGAPLLFYKSDVGQYVQVIGVTEQVARSRDPNEIAAFVGKRTVYPLGEIQAMCAAGEVLAVLFRQAVALNEPIRLDEFLENGALKGPPQSITTMKKEAHRWFRQRLEQSSCFPFGPSTRSH